MATLRHGKVGLALSGGGFRAAFYHVGVLAYLADTGLLRRVEVISTVSGGSIVGALYYLHLKRLLESVPDEAISDADYREVVRRVEHELFAAVQRNFRLSAFVSVRANWRMLRSDYSRTDRLGELYDEWLFRPAAFGTGGARHPVRLRDLKIHPCGSAPGFHPRRDNYTRSAKVPILLINAATLNTGRNWRFTASRMGEGGSSSPRNLEIDTLPRYVQAHSYDALPPHLACFPLGKAVAASTAVPGLFRPLPLGGLYPGRMLQLVDGAVHDNQGIQGLLDEKCDILLVSDASSPLNEVPDPDPNLIPVLQRTQAILLHRVREEQLNRAATLKLALLHMRQGITPPVIAYAGPQGAEPDLPRLPPAPSARRPRVHPEVQERLSRVRTDLDSFTEVEAFSLMSFGYKVSEAVIPHTPGLGPVRTAATKWRFQAVDPWMEEPTADYLRQLTVASGQLFKVFRLVSWTRWLALMMLVAILVVVFQALGGWNRLVQPQSLTIPWSWGAALLAAGLLAVAYLLRLRWLRTLSVLPLPWARRPVVWLARVLFESLLPVAAALFLRLYLATFDRLFAAAGRLDRLQPPAGRRVPPRRSVQ